ncbi:glycerophosphodiester phosphodiesterase family protein [Actinomadura sp. DC4]|uniref:glycerophosphodiester phosphodiesterase n=1 Tax=Actinomadura sp. DC4 TaxID=3055069 RepID=UPI0025B12E37|nr:glycerophosphodiester phosphodiesterase family protein [Actinomadura sp. DC4]MDN3351827.1 glycerophosphodiester phosphodiesterase family protein [Actinomadura sp. DC4]
MRASLTALVATGLVVSASAATAANAAPSPRPKIQVRLADLPQHYFIAHRGAGAYVAPENTEQALSKGNAEPDANLLEFDVRVLTDGVGGVWHDPTVDRVSTSTGSVDDLSSAAFDKLVIDSKTWFGGGVANTHPVLLDQVLTEFGGKRLLLAHPKDTAAMRLVIDEVTRRGLTPAVQVQTFSRSDLELALAAGMNGQLLIEDTAQAQVDDPASLVADGVPRVSLHDTLPDSVIRSYVEAGLAVSVWNVDRQYRRDQLYAMGVRGIDSNDPTYVSGDTAIYHRTSDPFSKQAFWYGQISQSQTADALSASKRGRFITPNLWHADLGEYPLFVLQGWASPLPKTYTLHVHMRYDSLGTDRARWAGVYFSAKNDAAYSDADSSLNGGYSAILRTNGQLGLYRKDAGKTVTLKTITTPAIKKGQTASLHITVSGTTVKVTRVDGPDKSVSAKDTKYRGKYLFLGRHASTGHQGPGVTFSYVGY